MFRAHSLKRKEVINIVTAERIGYISDVEIGEREGVIESIIVPKRGGFFSFLIGTELVIPWDMVEVVGRDVVLVRNDYKNQEKENVNLLKKIM